MTTIDVGVQSRRAVTRAFAVGLLLAGAAGCHKTAAVAADDGAAAAASASAAPSASVAAADDGDAGADDTVAAVAPPDAVVAADPNIPLNEAVVGTAPQQPDYFADTAPPAPVVEPEPAKPDPADIWVPGYWWWSKPLARYVWVSGAWRNPPPDQVWFPGAWNHVGAHYVWQPGYWGTRGYVREAIETAPPPLRVEVEPPMPSAGMVWTPGYYAWRNNAYVWTAGVWERPPHPGNVWIEPHYVSSGGRYFLQPGRWDVPPEHRGVVYKPDINVRPGARVVLTAAPPALVVNHATFVVNSTRAVERGAVRAPNGGFVAPPRARGREVVDVHATPGTEVQVRTPGGREQVDVHAPGAHVDVVAPHANVVVNTHPGGAAVVVRPGVREPHPPRR